LRRTCVVGLIVDEEDEKRLRQFMQSFVEALERSQLCQAEDVAREETY
jgi:hypothetical protein